MIEAKRQYCGSSGSRSSSPPPPPSSYPSQYRFHRARPPHNRDKLRGWKAERGSRREEVEEEARDGKRETDGGRSLLCTQFPRGRGRPAAVSLRENKVSLHARQHTRTARCCRAEEGGGGGSEVLINIFSGIRGEIKLTARICESFVTGYPHPPLPLSLPRTLPLRFSRSSSHHVDCESQFFSGSLDLIETTLAILGVMISTIFHCSERQFKYKYFIIYLRE